MDYVPFYQKINMVEYTLVFSEFLTSSIQFHDSQCQSSIINIINQILLE